MKPIRIATLTAAALALLACNKPAPTTAASTPAAAPATTVAAASPATTAAMAATSAANASTASAQPAAKAESNVLGLQRPKYDKTNANWKFGVM
ncbi:MAG TPA: hypothetical protein VMV18_01115, partial [bacterium]|nr:hypothetical protein [bacterium]